MSSEIRLALITTEPSIDSLVDFEDKRFDYTKNWLLQSIGTRRFPIEAKDAAEDKLRAMIPEMDVVLERLHTHMHQLRDNSLIHFVQRKEKFYDEIKNRFGRLATCISPDQTDEANVQSYEKIEVDVRRLVKACLQCQEEYVSITFKGHGRYKQLFEKWNALRHERWHEYASIPSRQVAEDVVRAFRRQEQRIAREGTKSENAIADQAAKTTTKA